MTDHRPWFAHYPEGVPHTLEPYPEKNLYSLLAEAAARHPNAPAVVWCRFPAARRSRTRELLGRDREVLRGRSPALGVKKGDRVALVLPNCPQYVIAYYATLRIGGVIVGNNPLYTARELTPPAERLRRRGRRRPRLAVARTSRTSRRDVRARARPSSASVTDYMPFPINMLAPHEAEEGGEARGPPVAAGSAGRDGQVVEEAHEGSAGTPPPVAEVDAKNDAAGFIYTGGTTGLSKGAMLTHCNLVANVMQGAAWFPDLGDGTDCVDVRPAVLPFLRHDRVHERRHPQGGEARADAAVRCWRTR